MNKLLWVADRRGIGRTNFETNAVQFSDYGTSGVGRRCGSLYLGVRRMKGHI